MKTYIFDTFRDESVLALIQFNAAWNASGLRGVFDLEAGFDIVDILKRRKQ